MAPMIKLKPVDFLIRSIEKIAGTYPTSILIENPVQDKPYNAGGTRGCRFSCSPILEIQQRGEIVPVCRTNYETSYQLDRNDALPLSHMVENAQEALEELLIKFGLEEDKRIKPILDDKRNLSFEALKRMLIGSDVETEQYKDSFRQEHNRIIILPHSSFARAIYYHCLRTDRHKPRT